MGCGTWVSPKGKCRITCIGSSLRYEEMLVGGQQLHGWLIRRIGEEQCWQASLSVEDLGEEPSGMPEVVGDIEVSLLSGWPRKLQTRIRVANEDVDWQPPILFDPHSVCFTAKTCGGARHTRRHRGRLSGRSGDKV